MSAASFCYSSAMSHGVFCLAVWLKYTCMQFQMVEVYAPAAGADDEVPRLTKKLWSLLWSRAQARRASTVST